MKYFSMFSGIGGFELGIERAFSASQTEREVCRKTDKHLPDNIEQQFSSKPLCIGFSEIDRYAISIYKRHFKEHKNYGSATDINPRELPDFDLLVGGFPCQAFSIAGKRRGFEEARGTLFFEIARISREKQPRFLLLENVKGLLSHEKGKTFATILSTLDEIGYDAEWQVLNSKDFGVPQNRERVFIVGHLRGESTRRIFPITGANKKDTRNVGEDLSYALDANYHKGTNTLSKGRRQLIIEKMHAMRWQRTEKGKQLRKKHQAEGKDYTPFSEGCRELVPVPGKPVGALTAQAIAKDSLIGNHTRIRRLTPVECERLQGFPDNWTAEGTTGKISNTQRYKCLGNAVTVNVIEAIMERLITLTGKGITCP